MWIIFSFLSSVFAALMAIFTKIGLKSINPILGLSLRTFIVSIFCIVSIIINKSYKEIPKLNNVSLLWIFLTSIVTFLTWLFYYLALSKGEVHKTLAIDKLSIVLTVIISVIFLHEKISIYGIIGILFLVIGGLMVALF